jgi:CRP-like cAMP-binding protein
MAMLSASALFTGLSPSDYCEIASSAEAQHFRNNEHLFMQGQQSLRLIVVQTGSIKLTQLSPYGLEAVLWIAAPGDSVGLPIDSMACVQTCSARAMANCTVLVWDFKRLEQLIERSPQIRRNINSVLFDRLTNLEERFREVATQKVAQRLASTLLRLARQIGSHAHGGTQVSFSREELAQMTGTTLFTISRLLSKWSETKIVLPRREAVVVLDIEQLRRLSKQQS